MQQVELTSSRRAYLKSLGRFYYCNLKQAIDVEYDLGRANLFASEIKKAFVTPEEREFYKSLLTERQWEDLKRLVEIIKTGKIVKSFADVGVVDTKITFNSATSEYEKEIRNKILDNPLVLQKALNLPSIEDISYEYNLDSYGRSDLWVCSQQIGYPIEIKDEIADMKVVGQINKYIKGALALLHLGFYEWVTGVVIAPSFTKEAIGQLKANEVILLQVSIVDKQLVLDRV